MSVNFNGLALLGLLLFGSLAACTQGQTDTKNKKQSLGNEVLDSIQLDSLKKAVAEAKRLSRERAAFHLGIPFIQPVSQKKPDYKNTPLGYDTPQEQKRKGWEDAAKGTPMGTGIGAGLGLLDSGKRQKEQP